MKKELKFEFFFLCFCLNWLWKFDAWARWFAIVEAVTQNFYKFVIEIAKIIWVGYDSASWDEIKQTFYWTWLGLVAVCVLHNLSLADKFDLFDFSVWVFLFKVWLYVIVSRNKGEIEKFGFWDDV